MNVRTNVCFWGNVCADYFMCIIQPYNMHYIYCVCVSRMYILFISSVGLSIFSLYIIGEERIDEELLLLLFLTMMATAKNGPHTQ